jgi:D-3-phosphoglycerate dehydrogenase
MKILITDQVDQQCCDILTAEGFEVEYKPGMPASEIQQAIVTAHALIVRSQTEVTSEILNAGKMLKIVGRAGAGVDNIDVQAATRCGIIVMNTPGGNTVSTAEHTISMMMALSRNIPQAHQSLKEGRWDRKKYTGTELFGKTLGIIGLGKVGVEVAKRCLAFEMNVIAFDPILSSEAASKIGVELVDLNEIFRRSDIITIHSPLMPETKNLLNEESFKKCKRGVRVINCARGGIINERALLAALEEGRVGGAALDVFEEEPPKNNSLLLHPRVVATPHLGASTEEAQEKVAIQIAHQIADALNNRGLIGSVNADIIQLAMKKEIQPYMFLAEKMGSFIAQLLKGKLKSLMVSTSGALLRDSLSALGSAVIKGMFEKMLFEPVNYLNANLVARERGITLQLHQGKEDVAYAQVITVRYETDQEQRSLSGTMFGNNDVRIINIDGFHFEIRPEGTLLVYSNIDKPGMLAAVGGVLAKSNINIAGLSLGRYGPAQKALTVVSLDSPASGGVLNEISSIEGVSNLLQIFL